MKRTESSLEIFWRPSVSKFKSKITYSVHYRADSSQTPKVDRFIEKTSHKITNLKPNEKYFIFVVAQGDYGSSMPSDEISDFTKRPETIIKDEISMKKCCIDSQISADCVTSLCTVAGQRSAQNVNSCLKYRKKFYQCLLQNGNHTSCCKRRGVPEKCYPICDSTVGSNNLYGDCNRWMPDILSCADENMIVLPQIPMNITVESIHKTNATIRWNEIEGINKYFVTYFTSNIESPKMKTTKNSFITLTNLNEDTLYHATVQSVNGTVHSLKSTDVSFLTHSQEDHTFPNPPPTSLPYDIKKCCKEKSVSTKCMEICKYDLDLKDVGLQHLECIKNYDLSAIISCGNSGRDHTECCRNRRVAPRCVSKCKYNLKDGKVNWLASDNNCLSDLPSIISCMEDGADNIPTAPTKLQISSRTTHSLTLEWNYPDFLANKVEHYEIFRDPPGNFTPVSNKMKKYVINNLVPNTEYRVYVISVGRTGSSLPSYVIDARTLPGDNSTILKVDVSKCCSQNKVESKCLSACDGSVPLNLNQCGKYVTTILKCAANKKDHTDCCKTKKVTDDCLQLCNGAKKAAFKNIINQLNCHTDNNMKTYFSCYAGAVISPKHFFLKSKTNQSLTFFWQSENFTYDLYYSFVVTGDAWVSIRLLSKMLKYFFQFNRPKYKTFLLHTQSTVYRLMLYIKFILKLKIH